MGQFEREGLRVYLYKTSSTWDRRTNVDLDLGTDCNAAPLGLP
jgi:hypothetical protein